VKIIEAVRQNIEAMKACGHCIDVSELRRGEVEEFGEMEILSLRSAKGRRGRVYTVFTTGSGKVGFWPLASMGPRIGWMRK
jgi:hypothetical protein